VPSTSRNEKAKNKPVKTQMSKTNVLIKFILDQTFGAVVNTLMFLVFMGYVNASPTAKGGAWNTVAREVQDKFYPMIMDGYKFWPGVSLISFLWIRGYFLGALLGLFGESI
jgi:hypothetical protein